MNANGPCDDKDHESDLENNHIARFKRESDRKNIDEFREKYYGHSGSLLYIPRVDEALLSKKMDECEQAVTSVLGAIEAELLRMDRGVVQLDRDALVFFLRYFIDSLIFTVGRLRAQRRKYNKWALNFALSVLVVGVIVLAGAKTHNYDLLFGITAVIVGIQLLLLLIDLLSRPFVWFVNRKAVAKGEEFVEKLRAVSTSLNDGTFYLPYIRSLLLTNYADGVLPQELHRCLDLLERAQAARQANRSSVVNL